jgi:coenzyme F420-reducing hydrogenase delta subunit
VESADRLEARVTASEAKMEALNRLLEEKKGRAALTVSSSERTKQFDHQFSELNARLEKLQPSN